MKNTYISMLVVICSLIFSFSVLAEGQTKHLNVKGEGPALQGYDAVSYFGDDPVAGKADFNFVHEGIRYLFASQENMEKFTSEPQKYLPAYGGWCAWAMLDGEKVKVNPKRYKIINGINHLFYDGLWGNTLKKWNEKAESETEQMLVDTADNRWQKIIAE